VHHPSSRARYLIFLWYLRTRDVLDSEHCPDVFELKTGADIGRIVDKQNTRLLVVANVHKFPLKKLSELLDKDFFKCIIFDEVGELC
jgi:hypothetical protein